MFVCASPCLLCHSWMSLLEGEQLLKKQRQHCIWAIGKPKLKIYPPYCCLHSGIISHRNVNCCYHHWQKQNYDVKKLRWVSFFIHSHYQKSELRLREYLDLSTGSIWRSWWKVHSIGGRAVKVLHSEIVGDMGRVLCMKDPSHKCIFLSYHITPAFIIKGATADDKMKKSSPEFSLPLLQAFPSIFTLCYGPQKDENSWHTEVWNLPVSAVTPN